MLFHITPKRGGLKTWRLTVVLTTLLIGFASSPLQAKPQLQTDSALATAGYFRLSWTDSENGTYQLQQARYPDFRDAQTIYHGPDQATVVSGLADGDYYYRILEVGVVETGTYALNGAPNGSIPVKVEVRHHPLSRALAFFALGAIIFIITLVVLIRGSRKANA